MSRFRKVLVAVDGSDSSRNAFRQACAIARQDGSWLWVVSAVPPYQDQFQSLSVKELATRALHAEAEKIISDIKAVADSEGVYIRPELVEAGAVDAILDLAEEKNFDLIVVGRKGRGRIERALVGSVTARVVGSSHCDVLVVPRNAALSWKALLVAVDGSDFGRHAAARAIELAAAYGSSLKVLSIVDVTDEFQTQAPDAVEKMVENAWRYVNDVRRDAGAKGISAAGLVREGDSSAVISRIAQEHDASMIVMGSHGRTGVRRLFLGSVAEKVIGRAPCPVLVVKARISHE